MEGKNGNLKINLVLIFVLIAVAIGLFVLIKKPFATKTVTVKKTVYPWEANIDKQFEGAKEVDPSSKVKDLNNVISSIIKETVKADVKLTESSDNKLKYVTKTIIVEGDVDTIKKSLESKGYADVKITNNYKNLSAKKNNQEIKIVFSVDTTDRATIEVTL